MVAQQVLIKSGTSANNARQDSDDGRQNSSQLQGKRFIHHIY